MSCLRSNTSGRALGGDHSLHLLQLSKGTETSPLAAMFDCSGPKHSSYCRLCLLTQEGDIWTTGMHFHFITNVYLIKYQLLSAKCYFQIINLLNIFFLFRLTRKTFTMKYKSNVVIRLHCLFYFNSHVLILNHYVNFPPCEYILRQNVHCRVSRINLQTVQTVFQKTLV